MPNSFVLWLTLSLLFLFVGVCKCNKACPRGICIEIIKTCEKPPKKCAEFQVLEPGGYCSCCKQCVGLISMIILQIKKT